MPVKFDELDNLIRGCVRRLARARDDLRKAQDEVTHLEGELEGLRAARRTLQEEDPQLELPIQGKSRNISSEWSEILCHFLARAPNPLSIDDIMGFIALRGFAINRNAVRSQLHLYMNRGFLERVSDGVYRATDLVKRLC